MILMYHHVSPPARVPAETDRWRREGWAFTISPERLRRQLESLQERGHQFFSMADYVRDCTADRLSPNAVAVTFDDAWRDNHEFAAPILHELGISACFFAISGGSPENRMTAIQLRELLSIGMDIGGHSRTHTDLTQLKPVRLREEVGGCKSDLEQAVGSSIDYFAYPGGRFNRRVEEAVQAAGYRAACSIIGGGANGPDTVYWLHRETLTSHPWSLRDRLFLHRGARRLLALRAKRRVRAVMS